MMLRSMEGRPDPITAVPGDAVKILSGAFDGFDAVVDDVNSEEGTVKVTIVLFGRPTPLELEGWKFEAA